MSALGISPSREETSSQEIDPKVSKNYTFEQKIPIPSYLIAIASGEVAFAVSTSERMETEQELMSNGPSSLWVHELVFGPNLPSLRYAISTQTSCWQLFLTLYRNRRPPGSSSATPRSLSPWPKRSLRRTAGVATICLSSPLPSHMEGWSRLVSVS